MLTMNCCAQAGVRCSLRLEVPIADEGRMLVDDAYLKYLITFANQKFDINTARIRKLEQILAAGAAQQAVPARQQLPGVPAVSGGATGVDGAQSSGVDVVSGAVPVRVAGVRRGKAARAADPVAPLVSLKARQVAVLKRLAALEQAAGVQSSVGQQPGCAEGRSEARRTARRQGKASAAGGSKLQGDVSVVSGTIVQQGEANTTKPENQSQKKAAGKGGANSRKGVRPAASSGQAAVAAAAAGACDTADGAPHSLQLSVFPEGPMAGPHWRTMPMGGLQSMSHGDLLRWGHASVAWRGSMVVIGGYGGEGTHTRRADVLVFDPAAAGSSAGSEQGAWRIAEAQGPAAPCPRMGHAVALLGDYVVLIGGRTSPAQPLNDVWALHLPTMTWHAVSTRVMSPPGDQLAGISTLTPASAAADGLSGSTADATKTAAGSAPVWPGRYRHTAVADGMHRVGVDGAPRTRSIVVFGGRNDVEILGDVWVLQVPCVAAHTLDFGQEWTWVEVPSPGRTSTSPTAGTHTPSAAAAAAAAAAATAAAAGSQTAGPAAASDASATSHAPSTPAQPTPDTGASATATAEAAGVVWPCARKSHAAASLAGKMYLHGGATAYGQHLDDMYCMDFSMLHTYLTASYVPAGSPEAAAMKAKVRMQAQAWLWKPLKPLPGGVTPPACFSHQLVAWGAHRLILVGGYPMHHHSSVFVYETVRGIYMGHALRTSLALCLALCCACTQGSFALMFDRCSCLLVSMV